MVSWRMWREWSPDLGEQQFPWRQEQWPDQPRVCCSSTEERHHLPSSHPSSSGSSSSGESLEQPKSGLYEHVVSVVHDLPPQALMRVSPVLQPVFISHLIIETVHQTITITRCVSPRLHKLEILQSLLDEKLSLAQRQKLRLLRCSWPRQVVEQEIFSFWSRTGLTLTIYSLSEILMAEYRSDTYCWLRRWVKSELTDYGQCRIICWQQPNVVVLFGLGDENHKVRLDQSNRSFT